MDESKGGELSRLFADPPVISMPPESHTWPPHSAEMAKFYREVEDALRASNDCNNSVVKILFNSTKASEMFSMMKDDVSEMETRMESLGLPPPRMGGQGQSASDDSVEKDNEATRSEGAEAASISDMAKDLEQ